MAWLLRGCPHCGGDTFLGKDIDNVWVENCLQCGYEVVKNNVNGKLQAVKPFKKQHSRQLVRSK